MSFSFDFSFKSLLSLFSDSLGSFKGNLGGSFSLSVSVFSGLSFGFDFSFDPGSFFGSDFFGFFLSELSLDSGSSQSFLLELDVIFGFVFKPGPSEGSPFMCKISLDPGPSECLFSVIFFDSNLSLYSRPSEGFNSGGPGDGKLGFESGSSESVLSFD